MRLIAWVAYATLFLVLFGLALNNQHEAVVKGFFGTEWRAPMIVLVLLGFGAGALLTLAAMLPGRFVKPRRRPPQPAVPSPAVAANAPPATTPAALDIHPPRDGL